AVLRGGAIRQLRKQLTELGQSAGQWKETLGETQKALGKTEEEAGRAEAVLGEYDAKLISVGRAIEEAASYRPSPDDAKARPLSEGEARAAEYGTVLWLGIILASAALMMRIAPSPRGGAAVAVVSIAIGAFLRSTFDRGATAAAERLQRVLQAVGVIAGA